MDKLERLVKYIEEDKTYHADDLINRMSLDELNTNYEGFSPLVIAIMKENYEIIYLLLERGVDVNIKTNTGKTALFEAVRNSDVDLIEELISRGANVNEQDRSGETTLMLATQINKLNIIKLLVALGARLDLKDEYDDTAILIVNKFETLRLLLQLGANPNEKDQHGRTPLIKAVERKRTKYVKLLFDYNTNPNEVDNKQRNALHYAVKSYCPLELFRLLLDNGVDVNKQDDKGNTPIMLAVKNVSDNPKHYIDVIKVLLEYDPDLTLKNNDNLSIFDIAKDEAEKTSYIHAMVLIDYHYFLEPAFGKKKNNEALINPTRLMITNTIERLKVYFDKLNKYCMTIGVNIDPEYIQEIGKLLDIENNVSDLNTCLEIKNKIIDKLQELE